MGGDGLRKEGGRREARPLRERRPKREFEGRRSEKSAFLLPFEKLKTGQASKVADIDERKTRVRGRPSVSISEGGIEGVERTTTRLLREKKIKKQKALKRGRD